MSDRCNAFVMWWDGEYEGNCILDPDHEGDHWDGVSWYDDDGKRQDERHS